MIVVFTGALILLATIVYYWNYLVRYLLYLFICNYVGNLLIFSYTGCPEKSTLFN